MKSRSTIPQPKTSGVVKVPVVMQLEALECGAAALAMVMAYYGKWVPLEQVRVDCGVSRDGVNAKNIVVAARKYGFEVSSYRMDPQTIQKEGRFLLFQHPARVIVRPVGKNRPDFGSVAG